MIFPQENHESRILKLKYFWYIRYMQEIWKDIEGYEGLYQVSNYGRIKSLDYRHKGIPKIMVSGKQNNGYMNVGLWKDRQKTTYYIHRLVAKAFLPNPDGLPEVNHIDECLSNNMVTNLEWCTSEYNANYGTRNERMRVNKRKRAV